MDASMSLISATISFRDGHLALIHIPLELYSFFLQPILRLLFGDDHDEDARKIPWTDRHNFLNVSITPIECSVVCSRELAERLFRPLADFFNQQTSAGKDKILVSRDDFVVIQVDGQGLDAGQRVLELTRPLAMAGISLFFKTTYFSDYILVPVKARSVVVTALEQRGFTFSVDVSAFMHRSQLSPPSSSHRNRHWTHSSDSHTNHLEASFHSPHQTPPSTPPAADVFELQARTFARLRKNNISPSVDGSIRLFSCAGRKEESWETISRLKDDLIQCLMSTNPLSTTKPTQEENHAQEENAPDNSIQFLSLTLTDTEPISLFIESRFLISNKQDGMDGPSHSLGNLSSSILGSRDPEDVLVPITLNLTSLPFEATGIVCGVAGQLAANNSSESEAVEISFLSTAKAGTVLVREKDLDRAVEALERGFGTRNGEEDEGNEADVD